MPSENAFAAVVDLLTSSTRTSGLPACSRSSRVRMSLRSTGERTVRVPTVARYGVTSWRTNRIAASIGPAAIHHVRPRCRARPSTIASATNATTVAPPSPAPNPVRSPTFGKCSCAGTVGRHSSVARRAHTPPATAKVAARPMRVAVISDVHANFHALDAALRAIDGEDVDVVWCLGDVVGYGPRPNECCETVQARADLCLVGNHDLVVPGALTVSDFN